MNKVTVTVPDYIERQFLTHISDDDLHKMTTDAEAAEEEFEKAIQKLDRKTRLEIDEIVGRIENAFEMQGFLYGVKYCTDHSHISICGNL